VSSEVLKKYLVISEMSRFYHTCQNENMSLKQATFYMFAS
jgi:hypothetical protein